jgi:hypothetical protein
MKNPLKIPCQNLPSEDLIAEIVDAWREWDATPVKMFSDRLINAMHTLSELYPKKEE